MVKGVIILLSGLMIGSIIIGAIGYHEDSIYDVEDEWDKTDLS